MSLEKLLKPVKRTDQEILRYYSKIAKKWEDKGRNIYHLTSMIGLPSKVLIILGVDQFYKSMGFAIELSLYNWDWTLNLSQLINPKKEIYKDGAYVSPSPLLELCKKINRTVRLPTIIASAGLIGKSAYDVAKYFITGEPTDSTTISSFMLGMGLFQVASSQYLKDRNPKLLEKSPAWKTAHNWIKEKAKSLVPSPQPIPQPVSINNYKTIDNYT